MEIRGSPSGFRLLISYPFFLLQLPYEYFNPFNTFCIYFLLYSSPLPLSYHIAQYPVSLNAKLSTGLTVDFAKYINTYDLWNNDWKTKGTRERQRWEQIAVVSVVVLVEFAKLTFQKLLYGVPFPGNFTIIQITASKFHESTVFTPVLGYY